MKAIIAVFLMQILVFAELSRGEMAPMVIKAPRVSSETRDQLAREVVSGLGLDQKIEASFQEASEIFKRSPLPQNNASDELNYKSLLRAQLKFEKEKEDLKKKALDLLTAEFTRNFSESELKYLKESTKYPVFVRFSSFLTSKEYLEATNLAPVKASEYLREARLEILKEHKKSGK
jgi:hypothetical protein